MAAAIGGAVVAVDLFDKPQTLADYRDAPVAGYALDAEDRSSPHPRRRDVRRVLAEIAAATVTETGGRVHARGRDVIATALLHDDTVVHLAASVDRTGDGDGAPRRWFAS